MLPLVDRLRRRIVRQASRLDRLEGDRARGREPVPWGFGWGRYYLPHYFASAEPADFHATLFDQLGGMHERRGTKEAVIAPREGAKSTVVTLAYVLWCAVRNLERYVLILSDSSDQANEKLADVRRELEDNPRLAADFPGACGLGPKWRTDRLELRNGVVIQAIGRRRRVRGRRNREARPSLVVFDDVENNQCITSSVERDATWRWATREVIPAGSAATNFLSVGSALHAKCVAVRLGQLAGWSGRRYRAVHAWPERMDLWDRWERVATNLADDDRAAAADAFYAANRAEMDRGAAVYWPSRWTVHDLMKRRAEIGPAAFTTEYQGVPATEGLTAFPAEFFERPGLWFDEWPERVWACVQALDPSKGENSKTGDFQAHVLVAVDHRGDLWVEAVLTHEIIPQMVARAIGFAAVSGVARLDRLVVENNDSLGMLVPEFERQLSERRIVLPVEGVVQTQNKVTRIQRLELYLARNRVRFRNTAGTRLLVDQLREFPQADHDDGPDALELAIRRLEILTMPQRGEE